MNATRALSLRRSLAFLVVVACAAAGAGTASAGTVHFKSPSGNINCYVGSTPTSLADCIVKSGHWAKPPTKPASCHLDFDPYEARTSATSAVLGGCRGDVGPLCFAGSEGHCTVLAYGHSVTVGKIRCSSATTGVTCRSTIGMHPGFKIARLRAVLYP